MTYKDRAFDNPINWSFRIGRLFGIVIRVHVIFVLCAVVLVAMELRNDSQGGAGLGSLLVDALGIYGLLFLVVLLHEFGHCYGCRAVGGEAEEILLWPLGGLAYVNPPHTPSAHMVTTVAGPLVNVVICMITSTTLAIWMGSLGAVPWNPIHPMVPVDQDFLFVAGPVQLWTMRLFGVSYFLLLVNLLPIFPFDGGRILQAYLWSRKGFHRSMTIATGTGMVGAALVGVFGLLFADASWVLLMIAVFGYMTCWQSRKQLKEVGEADLGGIGLDFSQGYVYGEADEAERKPGFFERRRIKKAERRAEAQRCRDQEHAKAVEKVLRKVSQSGLASLSPGERQTLEEETRRHRSTGSS